MFQLPANPNPLADILAPILGGAIQGVSQGVGQGFQQQRKQDQISNLFQNLEKAQTPLEQMQAIMTSPLEQKEKFGLIEDFRKREESQQKLMQNLLKEQQELQGAQNILNVARAAGYDIPENISPQDLVGLTPSNLSNILSAVQPKFELESEKLEAKRASDFASDVMNEYKGAKRELALLDRQEEIMKEAEESGQPLAHPYLVAFSRRVGLPIGTISNPASEEFEKLENEYVRGINDLFRGQIRNIEIETLLKTVPSLLNTPEGRKRILNLRRIENKAKIARGEAYKQIIKENNGKKPPNLDVLVDERAEEILNNLADQYEKELTETISLGEKLPPYEIPGPESRKFGSLPDPKKYKGKSFNQKQNGEIVATFRSDGTQWIRQ